MCTTKLHFIRRMLVYMMDTHKIVLKINHINCKQHNKCKCLRFFEKNGKIIIHLKKIQISFRYLQLCNVLRVVYDVCIFVVCNILFITVGFFGIIWSFRLRFLLDFVRIISPTTFCFHILILFRL